ncbi:GNAT family N-acetyltransferase [Maridesulfovibrio frigidus]|uniref:GNAT family N-acetyltransferase n=1 Tax=Maridesulfovibrio frigidus TaxID=340956 RepID=UPI0004E249C3|nr:GNAT family N-acetyltransferase [Maridesulfovibrio frigidus]
MTDFIIRTMSRDELNWAIDMAANEGWNPGLHDADSFYSQDPDGYLIGLLGDKIIGCISAVSYEGTFGFIGFYIIHPDYRGKGYGIQLWKAAMKRLEGHLIGLDGVFEQQDNYRKSDFTFQYSNIRFEHRNTRNIENIGTVFPETGSRVINPIGTEDISSITAYEHNMFPTKRRNFLTHWLNMPDSFTFAMRKDENICGYGVIRPCRTGYKIGPLFADSYEVADLIFQRLCSEVETNTQIYIDVPEVNEHAMGLASSYGMEKVFGTARMYTGEAPQLGLDKIFGVTTFELG